MNYFIVPIYNYGFLQFFVLIFFLSSIVNIADCQVVNDNIENRIQLKLNTPLSSATAGCTLQWECLNHKLTKKCVKYHNDQWFYIQTTNLEKYYINISNQECRDLRGVQLLVIDGQACEPQGYKIKKCISLGNQDDIFITLDSLDNLKNYLVLIDGYLHDFCSFQIEFSDEPRGIPLADQRIVRMKTKPIDDYRVEIYWSVPDSIATEINHYEIYRRHETSFNSKLAHEVKQSKNAFGIPRLDYVVDEILPDYGAYFYKIVGVGDHERILISKNLLQHPRPKVSDRDSKDWIEVDLHYPKSCKLKILVYNNSNYELLYWCNFNYSHECRLFEHYVKEYVDAGNFNFRIEVENLETKEKKSHLIAK